MPICLWTSKTSAGCCSLADQLWSPDHIPLRTGLPGDVARALSMSLVLYIKA